MDRNGDGGDTLNTTGLKEKGEAGEDEQEVIEVEEERERPRKGPINNNGRNTLGSHRRSYWRTNKWRESAASCGLLLSLHVEVNL